MATPDVFLPVVRVGDKVTVDCAQDGTARTLTLTIGGVSVSVVSLQATNLSPVNSITLRVERPGAGVNTAKGHTPDVPASGTFSFVLAAGDLVEGSRQEAYVEYNAGVITTSASFFFNVLGAIAP